MTRHFSSGTSIEKTGTFREMLRSRMRPVSGSLLLGCLAGSLAFIVYLSTIAPDITWSNFSSDGGELITASMTLGIAHPPGYPTYIFLGKLFSLLPVGTIALRYNLFSAVSLSVAAAFCTATAFEILPAGKAVWAAALASGLAFALSPLVWSQAVVAEVYALNLALLSIFIWSLLTKRSSLLSGFLLGLAITTHLTSLLMLPIGFGLALRGKRSRLAVGIIFGLLPLLTLPILGQLDSPVIWGEPSTFEGWWWLATAQLYRANIHLPDTWQSMLVHLSQWSNTILSQFAWIGWLFVIVGIFANQLGKKTSSWLLASSAIYAGFSITYSTDDAILNFLPALLLLTPLLAAGLIRLRYWALLFPLLLFALNFQAQNLRHEQRLRPMVQTILREIPENAIIVTPGDQSIFSLWYFHHVEGWRSDLILVDTNLLAFDWYRERLASQYPELTGLSVDNRELFQEMNSRIRPLCELSLQVPQDLVCHASSPGVPLPD